MTNNNPACEALAKRYDAKSKKLIDIKFLLQNARETSFEEACEEFDRLSQIVETKDGTKPLDFGDLRWKE